MEATWKRYAIEFNVARHFEDVSAPEDETAQEEPTEEPVYSLIDDEDEDYY